jgi:hypothetical protein
MKSIVLLEVINSAITASVLIVLILALFTPVFG